MADVTIAADFGSSLNRAICSTSSVTLEPELILLKPQVVQVPQKSIENYEKYKVGESTPENSAWLNFSEAYFAVGFLAKRNFHSLHSLQALKVDSAIPQTLALVGSFAQQKQLSSSFSLSLGILLPWNEIRDKEKFKSQISQALSNFVFRGESFSVALESFTASPEGSGVFGRGRVPQPGELRLRNPKDLNIVVVMLGYRNSSVLVIEKGELKGGATGDFGLARMIEKVQSFTSGQEAEILLPVICQVRGKLGKRVLQTLVRTNRKELQFKEIEEIAEAINDARSEYVALLRNWLLQHIPYGIQIDELLISGGTSLYLKTELVEFFKPFLPSNTAINWCETLEKRLVHTFGELISHNALECRLADAYGLFFRMLNRPLPLLKESLGGLNNVRAS